MIKLIDILRLMEEKQDLRIYLGDGEWIAMSAFTALKVIHEETLYRKVFHIEIHDSTVSIYLYQSEEE